MMTLEEIEEAELEIALVESMLDDLEEERLAPLRAVIDVDSDLQAYIYVADSFGQIQFDQEAPFVCEQIFLIGDQVVRDSNTGKGNSVAIAFRLMNGDALTDGTSAPTTNSLPPTFATAISASASQTPMKTAAIPVDVFTPAARFADSNPKSSPNTDSSHVLSCAWFIPRGSSMLAQMRVDAPQGSTGYSAAPSAPTYSLVGHKVTP